MAPESPVVERSRDPRRRPPAVPPQHGAWAFLALPLVLGLVLAGPTWLGGLFAVVWVLAYPASYYLGRALAVRLRRGSWSRIAKRERDAAVPWAVPAALGGLVLVVVRPWLAVVAVALGLGWALSVRLAIAGRERGFGNDVLLVVQSAAALPVLWYVDTGSWDVPAKVWWATGVCITYFVGSVIHVKSLIREAGDRRWHGADVAFHVAALTWAFLSPWLLLPFAAALGRALVMRPGLRPAVIGVVEMVVSVLVVIGVLAGIA
ncbi:MAG: YwiC-like family protein [Candidatus Nanopelagicales bacterium]